MGSGGLTNGAAADTDDRLRQRLLKLLREPQNGGSWAHYRQWAEDASAAVENALRLPGRTGSGDRARGLHRRGHQHHALCADRDHGADLAGGQRHHGRAAEFADATVTTVAHADLEIALKITLPEPPSGGGQGGGWVDDVGDRWAIAKIGAGNSNGVVTVTTVNSSTSFTVNAYNQPVDGSTVAFFPPRTA